MKFEDFCLNKINWLVFEGCKVIGRLTTLSANNIHTHICLYVRLYVFPTGCVGISAHVHTLIFSYVLIPYSCMCIGVFFGQCHINLGVVVMHYITMRAYCKWIYIYIFAMTLNLILKVSIWLLCGLLAVDGPYPKLWCSTFFFVFFYTPKPLHSAEFQVRAALWVVACFVVVVIIIFLLFYVVWHIVNGLRCM